MRAYYIGALEHLKESAIKYNRPIQEYKATTLINNIRSYLLSLTGGQQQYIEERYNKLMTIKQIADKHNISERTIRKATTPLNKYIKLLVNELEL